jgi:hypothetical protein
MEEYSVDMNPDDAPATKGDLRALALKGDALFVAMKGDMLALKGELQGEFRALHRGLALEIVKTNARIDKQGDDVRSEMRSLHSDLVRKIDGFMSTVGKIDRAQIIADWRLTELEKRADDNNLPS